MFDTTTFAENKAIVHVNGKIIGNAVTQFRDEIEQQLQDGNNNLIIDLTDVPLLDSTALGVIIITFQVLQKSGGKLVLLNPQKAVSSVLEVTRLTSILEVYESEEAARNAFS
ncbi:STAS domain-containing protein [Candidatus Poribacteria bacterium]|nr:STAS domain-containing protein [Candidatus Poribacteria bacterium]MYF57263.1 STAS domain-containing protein [Candidatus Poribacteria bacterium]